MSLPFFALTWSDQIVFGEDSPKKDLVQQQEKLNQETSAVGKVKALIKISDIHLRSASQDVKKSSLAAADRNLDLYKESVEKALKTLQSSSRNAQKNPAGFKELRYPCASSCECSTICGHTTPLTRCRRSTRPSPPPKQLKTRCLQRSSDLKTRDGAGKRIRPITRVNQKNDLSLCARLFSGVLMLVLACCC